MKRKLLKGVLTFGLAVSMIAGSLYIPEGSQTAQAAPTEETATQAENKTWDLTAASTIERPALEGTTGTFDGIQIDAAKNTKGKKTKANKKDKKEEKVIENDGLDVLWKKV